MSDRPWNPDESTDPAVEPLPNSARFTRELRGEPDHELLRADTEQFRESLGDALTASVRARGGESRHLAALDAVLNHLPPDELDRVLCDVVEHLAGLRRADRETRRRRE